MKFAQPETYLSEFLRFPSPCGEEVMKYHWFIANAFNPTLFPSPCGEEVMK